MNTQKNPPKCPTGKHNKLLGLEETCHTHCWKWRQWIHEQHCKKLKCPFAHHPKYGKWHGYHDTREKRIIG